MADKTVSSELLRPGLLDGVSVLLARAPAAADRGESVAAAVSVACTELGARVSSCDALGGESLVADEAVMEEAVAAALAERGVFQMLVVDCAGLFAAAHTSGPEDEGGGSRAALRGCLEASWNVTRALVNLAFLAPGRGGRVVFLAPAAGAGKHAEAACSGLENLARTLSVEWARHAITVVAIAPGDATAAGEVAALSAYLASPAGEYFSGCLLDLRGARGAWS